MPVLLVYGIPENFGEMDLEKFWEALRYSVASVEGLNIKIDQVSVFFPPDRLKNGLGEEIIIFVKGLFQRPERTEKVRQNLAKIVAKTVKSFFPKTNTVECFVEPFNPNSGFANV